MPFRTIQNLKQQLPLGQPTGRVFLSTLLILAITPFTASAGVFSDLHAEKVLVAPQPVTTNVEPAVERDNLPSDRESGGLLSDADAPWLLHLARQRNSSSDIDLKLASSLRNGRTARLAMELAEVADLANSSAAGIPDDETPAVIPGLEPLGQSSLAIVSTTTTFSQHAPSAVISVLDEIQPTTMVTRLSPECEPFVPDPLAFSIFRPPRAA